MNNNKKNNIKIVRLFIIILLTLLLSYIISFKFISREQVSEILTEDIFQYSYLITFLFTTIGVLVTLITFIYTMFDKFIEKTPKILKQLGIENNYEKNIVEDNINSSLYKITKELADNIKLVLALLIVVFIHFIGAYSKMYPSLMIFNEVFILAFIIEIYQLTILAIIDTVSTLLELLQYGLWNQK